MNWFDKTVMSIGLISALAVMVSRKETERDYWSYPTIFCFLYFVIRLPWLIF